MVDFSKCRTKHPGIQQYNSWQKRGWERDIKAFLPITFCMIVNIYLERCELSTTRKEPPHNWNIPLTLLSLPNNDFNFSTSHAIFSQKFCGNVIINVAAVVLFHAGVLSSSQNCTHAKWHTPFALKSDVVAFSMINIKSIQAQHRIKDSENNLYGKYFIKLKLFNDLKV